MRFFKWCAAVIIGSYLVTWLITWTAVNIWFWARGY